MNRPLRTALLLAGALSAADARAQLNATPLASGFTSPVFAAAAPGSPGTLYVVQQGGQVRTVDTATGMIGATFLDLTAISGTNLRTGGEQGLLGLAFHPNFQSNRTFYVHYKWNNGQAGGAMRVEQYQTNQITGSADPSTRRTVLEYDDRRFNNHNAGWIGFNPLNGTTGANSGHLYVPTGDGGDANDPDNNAQNLGVYTGKLLRIDVGNGLSAANPTYAIPAGNMTGAGVRPEVYSYGLRNPFRASFDRQTGDLYIGDVGQGSREEIDFIAHGSAGGQNFGWRLREGTIQNPTAGVGGPRPPDNVEPIHDYQRSLGFSVTGGHVYRGTWRDDDGDPLDGHYFFADYGSGRIFSLRYTGSFVPTATDRTTEFGLAPGDVNPSSFAEDGFGNLYLIDYNGTVYRLIPVPEPATSGLFAAAALAAGLGWRQLRRRRAGCYAGVTVNGG